MDRRAFARRSAAGQVGLALAPLGMTFVPSRTGISHAPEESTEPEAVARGADVLLRTLLAPDRNEPGPA